MNSKYKSEHIEFLKSINNGIYNKEMTDLFNERFGMNITEGAMQSLRRRSGIKSKAPRHPNQYTDEEVDYIEEIALGRSNAEITKLLNEKFETNRDVASVEALKYSKRILSFPNKSRPYKESEISYLKDISKGRSSKQITDMFNERFNDSRTENSIKSIRNEHGITSGVDTKFQKGRESENRSPIGSERVTSDGYTQVKVRDEGWRVNWEYKHILIWEEENGPVPDDHVVIFGDKDRANLDTDNLICISRSQLARLNHQGLIQEDTELTKTAINIVNLQAEIRELTKEED